MFDFHTYHPQEEPCLLNVDTAELLPSYPEQVRLSVGLHPWKVDVGWQMAVDAIRREARREDVWAIGECGLDRVRGAALAVQKEAFRAQVAIAEEVRKPMVIHCVRALDELLALRREVAEQCRRRGEEPQLWVVHGFRGKPEQAKQLMAKGMLLSFGHRYHVETLRWVFAAFQERVAEDATSCLHPFFLETDDLHLSVRQIYEQVARHLGVDVSLLASLCDPRRTLFARRKTVSRGKA